MRIFNQLCCILLLASLNIGCKDSTPKPAPEKLEIAQTNLSVVPGASPNDCFLSLADVHLDTSSNLVFYGGDTGRSLWKQTKKKVEAVIKAKQPKFMVYLGDLPSHGTGITQRKRNVSAMLNHLRNLNTTVPILYLPGNNDSPGGDYHSFTSGTGGNATNPFSMAAKGADPWPVINDSTSTTKVFDMDYNSEFGFYSAALNIDQDTLHVLALNTVIFSNSSSYPYVGDDNKNQQQATDIHFNWFRKKIDSYKATDRILVMMHIPPGGNGFGHHPMWKPSLTVDMGNGFRVSATTGFLQKIGEHKNKIVGVLTAHTHTDGLRRLHHVDSAGDTVLCQIAISTPGITVDHKNNPGFKVFEFEKKTFDLLDFETYYASPDAHGTNFTFQPGSSFTFRNTYGASATEKTMYDVIAGKSHRRYIVADMKKILYLNSGHGRGFNYDRALDVWP